MGWWVLFINRYSMILLTSIGTTAWTKSLDAAVDDVLKCLLQNSKLLASTSWELDPPSWAHIFSHKLRLSVSWRQKVLLTHKKKWWLRCPSIDSIVTIAGQDGEPKVNTSCLSLASAVHHLNVYAILDPEGSKGAQSPLGSGCVWLIHWCDTKMVKKELPCSTRKFASLSSWWLCILVILGKHFQMPDTDAVTVTRTMKLTHKPRVWRRLDTFKTHIGKCCLCQAWCFLWHAAFTAQFFKKSSEFPKTKSQKT